MTIRSSVEALRQVLDEYGAARQGIAANRDWTPEAKRRKAEEITEGYQARAERHVSAIWGSISQGGELKGGQAWSTIDSAKAALRTARDAAGGQFDFARLQVAGQALGSAMLGHSTAGDFVRWYDASDGHTRRAAQLFAPEKLRARWGIEAGPALRRLRQDAEQIEVTPAVRSAQMKLDSLAVDLRDAYRAARRAAGIFDVSHGALFGGVGMGGIGAIVDQVQQPGPDDPVGWSKKSNPFVEIEAMQVGG